MFIEHYAPIFALTVRCSLQHDKETRDERTYDQTQYALSNVFES